MNFIGRFVLLWQLYCTFLPAFLSVQETIGRHPFSRCRRYRFSTVVPIAFIRAQAFKWIRIIYRCWKTKTRYDEARYFLALEE
ncbi:hypothetical protein CSR06_24045 [Klebsiella pneumoniae]|uniref:Secreted protein n=1 Tax=Klebsiella pneumoniae TaxID=573 RepID=A0AAX1BQK9_KLEPN|nr:hypothetical protein CP554_17745 [Klebsiella pneumoniae]PXB71523.1 hypothetical protein DL507_07270 [Klebsiella pneumoniae]RHW11876.1 hypothetical protein CSR06_24045 [Klebsiella pneumoniae]